VFFRASYGDRLDGRRALLSNTVGPDFYELFVAVDGEEHWLMHHFLDEGESPDDYPPERMQAVVRKASGLPEVPVEVLSLSPWVMSPSLATCWRQGRIVLVGDAAARVSPSGGLGMNNGVQSAHNLAWKLAAVVNGQADAALLDSYEQERLPAARFTFANSGGNMEEIFAIVGTAMAGDWAQAKALIGQSRRAGSGLGQDFGIVYASGAVQPDGSPEQKPADAVNDYIPQGRPGHRAPHVWLQRDGARVSSLDCFGQGFVALCAAGADMERAAAWAPGAELLVEGRDFSDAPNPAEGAGWRALYGLGDQGAVLVRPDGYIAARVGGLP
jgi:putative polyketide hydroxylase